jgi:hypothetical protein
VSFIGHYGNVQPQNHTPNRFKRFAEAYKTMAKQARYRPVWVDPDLVPETPEQLDKEAEEYAMRFAGEDDTRHFFVGVSAYSTNRALVYAIEAARSMCGCQPDLAEDLLRMALKEIDEAKKRKE